MAKTAKRKPAKVRKPAPFRVGLVTICCCVEVGGKRWVELRWVCIGPRDMLRFSAWLARAQAWVEDKKGGG